MKLSNYAELEAYEQKHGQSLATINLPDGNGYVMQKLSEETNIIGELPSGKWEKAKENVKYVNWVALAPFKEMKQGILCSGGVTSAFKTIPVMGCFPASVKNGKVKAELNPLSKEQVDALLADVIEDESPKTSKK